MRPTPDDGSLLLVEMAETGVGALGGPRGARAPASRHIAYRPPSQRAWHEAPPKSQSQVRRASVAGNPQLHPLIDKFGRRHTIHVLTTWSPRALEAMGVHPINTGSEGEAPPIG